VEGLKEAAMLSKKKRKLLRGVAVRVGGATGYAEHVGVAWGGRPGSETVTAARTTSVSRAG
jgi:hypothetical protein